MATEISNLRSTKRTYYLNRDGSVTKVPTDNHLLRIRAESMEQATTVAWALRAKLQEAGLYLAFEEA